MSCGPLLRTALTAVETGYEISPLTAAGASRARRSAGSLFAGSSQSDQLDGSITIGILSWILPSSSGALVVMIVAVQSHARS